MQNKIVKENISRIKASSEVTRVADSALSHTFGNVRYKINHVEVDADKFREVWINGRNI